MTFVEAIWRGFASAFDFRGVTSRRAYWFFALFAFLLGLVLGVFDSLAGKATGNPNFSWFQLAGSIVLLLPQLALSARRFHDAGFTAKWLFAYLLPAAAFFVALPKLISFMQLEGTPTEAQIMDAATAIGPLLLSTILVGCFVLVVTLLPSKPYLGGNKYAKPTEGDIPLDDLRRQGW